jgi:hypothetical protein
MLRLFLVIMLIPSGFALAEMPPLKKSNFELVQTGQLVDEQCPFTKEDVQKVWEGELLRARLKKKETVDFDQGVLWFHSSCLNRVEDEQWVFAFTLEWTWSDPSGKYPMIKLSESLGYGGKSYAQDFMEQVIEGGITEYLKANLE